MLLYPIWLILGAIFFTFAYQHWRLSTTHIRPFRLREGEGDMEGMSGFVEDWNRYLAQVNANTTNRHRVAMAGYAVTGALALVSLFLTLPVS
jgi:hypothetical protein